QVSPGLPRPALEARVVEAATPAEGILSLAGDEGADLVVMSATGSSVVRSVLLGANTRKVVRRSACPVLVIPAANRLTARSFLEKREAGRSERAVETVPARVGR